MGEENLSKTIKMYFDQWKFKHPTPNDFIRVAEKVSGMELDWYLQDFGQTTNTIDYGIDNVSVGDDGAEVTLKRIGLMPMPIDLMVTYTDGSKESFYIPLQMVRADKDNPFQGVPRTVLPDWPWAYPTYDFTINTGGKTIEKLEIDPTKMMADVETDNNVKKM